MSAMVFYSPTVVKGGAGSGSGVRPYRMREAFGRLGYEVIDVSGRHRERRVDNGPGPGLRRPRRHRHRPGGRPRVPRGLGEQHRPDRRHLERRHRGQDHDPVGRIPR